MAPAKRRVLVIGGQFAGTFVARDLKKHFNVTIVDAKEYFEYTPGVLRAYVKPAHFDALTFTLQPVIERSMGVKFIWGEVKTLDGEKKTATIKPMFSSNMDEISFDYCVICAGCNFGPFQPMGESLWFPVIHEEARKVSQWGHIDERFIEGRRRHILEEYHKLQELNKKAATILVVGAGFIGVEWATEIEHFFPDIKLTIIDALPRCLGPLPDGAAEYCSEYMQASGIKQFYDLKYDAKSSEFWKKIELPNGADESYVCIGVKASNYFMPKSVLSDKGPGGGGWIHMGMDLAVTTKTGQPWGQDEKGYNRIYAIGDCNYGCVDGGKSPKEMDDWPIPPIPKISYPGEEQAIIACSNIHKIEKIVYHSETVDCWGNELKIHNQHWPWGAGMFATSLGPKDACFVAGASWKKNSGLMVLWGGMSCVQKEIIEASKTDECAYGIVGRLIWHFVHHTPVHFWGNAPMWGY